MNQRIRRRAPIISNEVFVADIAGNNFFELRLIGELLDSSSNRTFSQEGFLFSFPQINWIRSI